MFSNETTTLWKQKGGSFVAPTGATKVKILLKNASTVASVAYFDEIWLGESSDRVLVEQTQDYYPYGSAMRQYTSSVSTENVSKFKYQGKERDIESGYDYVEARIYDSQTIRFYQVDPLAELFPKLNSFVAMNNNPLCYTDKFGMAPEDTLNGGSLPEITVVALRPENKKEVQNARLVNLMNQLSENRKPIENTLTAAGLMLSPVSGYNLGLNEKSINYYSNNFKSNQYSKIAPYRVAKVVKVLTRFGWFFAYLDVRDNLIALRRAENIDDKVGAGLKLAHIAITLVNAPLGLEIQGILLYDEMTYKPYISNSIGNGVDAVRTAVYEENLP